MKRYCPTILILSLLAWAAFASCAWGGGPNDPFAPVGVRGGAVSSTGVYTGTGTGTGTGVEKYAYYHPDNYSYDYSGTSVVSEPENSLDLSQTDGAKAPLLQSRGGHACWYFRSADDFLAGSEGSWPNVETLATCTIITKLELASETTSAPSQYVYWAFTRASGYYVAGLQNYYGADNAVSACQILFDDYSGFGLSPLATVALGGGPVRVVSEVDWSTCSGRAWSYADDGTLIAALSNTFSSSKHVYASNNFRIGKPVDYPIPRAWIYWVKVYHRALTDSERLAEIND